MVVIRHAAYLETVAHIVSGCPTLVGTLYKKHHDEVGRRLYRCRFGFPVVKEWWMPKPVEESDC